ncbi:MAG: ORF6N domain-containing protein [bacterium]
MNENIITEIPLTPEIIREKIYIIRGKKVMIDRDLAILYEILTKQLNQSVRRNVDRFPEDFMFQLTKKEMDNWICQIGISNGDSETENWKSQFVTSNSTLKQSLRKPPLAFTEQGIAMLSSVLNSKRAIQVNIQIIRIFTKLREMIDAYKELREKVEEMEKNNEVNFSEIFRVIRLLITEKEEPKEKMGFRAD